MDLNKYMGLSKSSVSVYISFWNQNILKTVFESSTYYIFFFISVNVILLKIGSAMI